MRFTQTQPLLIGDTNGVVHHIVATGTAMGYDIDLHEEAWVTGTGAQAEINRGLFMLIDDSPAPQAGRTTFGVTFDSPGKSVDVATPVEAVNPNVAPDPTLESAAPPVLTTNPYADDEDDEDDDAEEAPVASPPKRRGRRKAATTEGDD